MAEIFQEIRRLTLERGEILSEFHNKNFPSRFRGKKSLQNYIACTILFTHLNFRENFSCIFQIFNELRLKLRKTVTIGHIVYILNNNRHINRKSLSLLEVAQCKSRLQMLFHQYFAVDFFALSKKELSQIEDCKMNNEKLVVSRQLKSRLTQDTWQHWHIPENFMESPITINPSGTSGT